MHGAGASASGAEKLLQQQLLERVVESCAAEVPPQVTVQAARVLASGPMHAPTGPDQTPSSWLQEGEDMSSLRQQLDALARGQHLTLTAIDPYPLCTSKAACCHQYTIHMQDEPYNMRVCLQV